MRKINIGWIGLIVLSILIHFDTLLLHPGAELAGDPQHGALALSHVWWPVFSLGQPDQLSIHSYFGAPTLHNHLLYMPVLQSAVFHALQGAIGPIAALNVILIASQIAICLCTFAYLKHKTLSAPLALTGTALLVLSAWFVEMLGRADLIGTSLFFLPLSLLCWERWRRAPSIGRAILLTVTVYAAVLSGVQSLVWIAGVVAPLACWQIYARERNGENAHAPLPSLRTPLFVIGTSLIILLFIYPMPNIVRSIQASEPLYGPLTLPVPQRSALGWIMRTSPLIFIAALLAVGTGKIRGEAALWLGLFGLFLLAGLGFVPDPITMIFRALGVAFIPLSGQSYLFGIVLFAGIMVATTGLQEAWHDHIPPTRHWMAAAGGLLAAILLSPGLFQPLPRHTIAIPDVYDAVAAESESYIVLNVPAGRWAAAGEQMLGQAAYLSREVVWHHKRTASAVLPYLDSEAALPAYLDIEAMTSQHRQTALAFDTAIREGRIGYVIVSLPLLTEDEVQSLADFLAESEEVCAPIEDGQHLIYEARWHAEATDHDC